MATTNRLTTYRDYQEPIRVSPPTLTVLVRLSTPKRRRRGQTVVDASKKPLASQTPHAGQHLLIAPVHIPPTMGAPGLFQVHSAFEVITVLDHARGRAAWANVEMPGWLLGAERWQAVSTVEVAGGGTRTRYETAEVFTGLLAYVVKWVMRGKLAMGFEAMAEGLKARAEGLERGA